LEFKKPVILLQEQGLSLHIELDFMVILPFREQIILLITLVGVFILFLVEDRRSKNKNHILNRIFHYFPDFNSDLRVGFSLIAVAAVCAVFEVYLYTTLVVLLAGLIFLYRGRN
jgi:Cu/Ag efflux pump CusA